MFEIFSFKLQIVFVSSSLHERQKIVWKTVLFYKR